MLVPCLFACVVVDEKCLLLSEQSDQVHHTARHAVPTFFEAIGYSKGDGTAADFFLLPPEKHMCSHLGHA
jgi:hypothetical protein